MLEKYSRAGLYPDAPFRICAISSVNSFGDYINALLFVTNVAARFDHSEVTFIYKENTDYKTPLLRTTNFKRKIAAPIDRRLPSMEYFSEDVFPPLTEIESNLAAILRASDCVITDRMNLPPLLCSFSPVSYLRFTLEDCDQLTKELEAHGLATDHWFCTLHNREPGYKYKPAEPNFRDAGPAPYLALRDFIITKLGGQVVRLGHPAATPFPPREGFVDLSRLPSSALLQAFAVSRARYLVSTPSGPWALGHAFGTPTARVNSVDYWQVSEFDLSRTVDVVMANGDVLRQDALYERGIDKHKMFAGLMDGTIREVIQNDFSDLCLITEALHRETSHVTRWRAPAVAVQNPAPNVITWPRRPVKRVRFISV